jgi:hypothetical protein
MDGGAFKGLHASSAVLPFLPAGLESTVCPASSDPIEEHHIA